MVLTTILHASPAALADEADLQQIRSQAERALEGGEIQRDAPLAERVRQQSESIAKDPTLQHEPPQPGDPPDEARFSMPIPGDIVLYLLLTVLAVALCIVLYHLYRTYASGRRLTARDLNQPLELGSRPIARAVDERLPDLDEIERLAVAGAYAEAVHLMLLRALEALRRRLGTSWAKSMTSREIARRSELPATDRQALKMLVGAVEISRFGGRSANEQIYRACLDQYRLIGSERGMART
ncbi:DUF4129 domain-containing protein [Dongia deserti]|uniref:DUF4129 domain-containing protein n=1 Tax=Dongia deserti TaxID=2268030 RepID=UPI000E654B79|nr:DUF4129 domain-containing protein [Dongia deserti]